MRKEHETICGISVAEKGMIWKHVSAADWGSWRWQIANSPCSVEELAELLPQKYAAILDESVRNTEFRYRFRATPYYLSLIDWSDAADPIRRQVIPDAGELYDTEAYNGDPFQEKATISAHGIVHRYPDRVLLTATTSCAMYCRHCTRKNTLDDLQPASASDFSEALAYIESHPGVREVLISGGDPLLLNCAVLDELLGRLSSIEHVEVIRIGSRIPVVLPMRVDDELVRLLQRYKPLWINTQFNHPRELTPDAISACRRITDAGIPLSNQSVLLKGVNDDFETMRELCASLQRNLIRPYYVFVCDPVAGIEPFRVSIDTARELQKRLRESLGGLAMPAFVADLPGKKSKTPV